VLPRDWDGRRLLRFLTGLAMLALAFTVHATPPAPALPAAQPAAAVASAVSTVATTPSATADELPALPPPPRETPLYVSSAIILLLITGFALRVRAERAPPLA
jgi:di/tricarboxylate transporter